MQEAKDRCRLYLITPPRLVLAEFAAQLEQAFTGGDIGAVQLRLKEASDEEIVHAAKALMPICHAREAAFILNDRADLAKICGADGVHLGQEDMAVAEARAILGEEAVIGVSCHASRHLAMEAGEHGADYVAFGAFYPTSSKPLEKQERWGAPEPEILSWWQAHTILPCVAIGGITPANCGPLAEAGADLIAAITAVWEHPKGPKVAVAAFNQAIADGMARRK